jgi:hypothetical protein
MVHATMRRESEDAARRSNEKGQEYWGSFGKRAYSGVRTGRIRANHQMLKNETHSLSNNAFSGLLSTNSCLVKPSHPYHAPRNRIVWLIYISLIIISNSSTRKLAKHCCFQGHSQVCRNMSRPHHIYQSSSSSLPRCIAFCLALKASANPPAKLGVLRPLSVPPLLVILVPESRGAGRGAGLRPPAAGRFAGGAGG